MVVSATRVTVLLLVPNDTAVLSVLIAPAKLIPLGAVAVKPPVKTKVPPLAPSVKVPVLLKVTALVIVPVVALSARL